MHFIQLRSVEDYQIIRKSKYLADEMVFSQRTPQINRGLLGDVSITFALKSIQF